MMPQRLVSRIAFQASERAEQRAVAAAAGVVHEERHLAERLVGALFQPLDISRFETSVATAMTSPWRPEMCDTPAAAASSASALTSAMHNLHADPGEALRRGAADARSRAGDDGGAALGESRVLWHSWLLRRACMSTVDAMAAT